MTKNQWKPGPGRSGNLVLEGKGYHISYLPKNGSIGILIPSFASDGNGDETALCVDGNYYILNGDFRKEYEKVINKGLSACMKVFEAHPNQISSWSDCP